MARDSALADADCLTEPALEEGRTADADALDGGRVDALDEGLMKGLEPPGGTEAVDAGLREGCISLADCSSHARDRKSVV